MNLPVKYQLGKSVFGYRFDSYKKINLTVEYQRVMGPTKVARMPDTLAIAARIPRIQGFATNFPPTASVNQQFFSHDSADTDAVFRGVRTFWTRRGCSRILRHVCSRLTKDEYRGFSCKSMDRHLLQPAEAHFSRLQKSVYPVSMFFFPSISCATNEAFKCIATASRSWRQRFPT